MHLKQQLENRFRGELHDDPRSLDAASRDASLFELHPELVADPADAADLGELVRFATEERKAGRKVSLTARSAGTDMSGGPLSTSIIVDMKPHFSGTLKVTAESATAMPGTYYRDFEKETLKKGKILPCYTSSRELCTIGGMAANNSAGEKTLKYGKMEDWTRSLKVVFADGNEYSVKPLDRAGLEAKIAQGDYEGDLYKQVYELCEAKYDVLKAAKPRVSKNSAGYYLWNVWNRETGIFDLTKLIVGSQGTLGLITEVEVGLMKPKAHARMMVLFLRDLDRLGDLVNDVLSFGPETFESFDDHTLKLAVRFAPGMAKQMKTGIVKLGFSLIPDVLKIISLGGIPKLMLMAEFTDATAEGAERQVRAAEAGIKKYGYKYFVTKHTPDSNKYWTIRRESFNLLRKHIRDVHTAPFIDDTVVMPADLPKFLPELNEIMGQYDLTYTVAGHIGNGNFHIIPLMDLTDPATKRIIPKLSREVYDLVLSYGGSITGEHNDGMIRTPYLLDMYGQEVYGLFEKTKRIFDPLDIFNPGKKVHGDLNYAMRHFVDDSHVRGDAQRWTAPADKKAAAKA